jgi:hypothetical protein
VLLLLSAFFLAGIVQIAALRGNTRAGYGLALITASGLIATPKLLTSLMPVGCSVVFSHNTRACEELRLRERSASGSRFCKPS